MDLFFDHGAPYFTVSKSVVLDVVLEWESRGLVAEWKETFGSFDCISKCFTDSEEESLGKKYVGVPGMNSICRALCNEPGVESKFGIGVAKIEWLVNQKSWSLTSVDGMFLGHFGVLVATDKLLASSGFSNLTGHPPPLDMNLAPQIASKIEQIPFRSYFVLMLAFSEPLPTISVKGFSFKNSEVLSSAFCDSSKPGRSSASECWVLHSTEEYTKKVIANTGRQKASDATFTRGQCLSSCECSQRRKVLVDTNKPLVVCGDFCVSPNVEGAIESGLAAASKFMQMHSCI
uniref:Amine oxidase domain-containing protein n=1 Tax=Chenopodium quinoa TaxID=63459 RepID=A0A803NA39_CHEQI